MHADCRPNSSQFSPLSKSQHAPEESDSEASNNRDNKYKTEAEEDFIEYENNTIQ